MNVTGMRQDPLNPCNLQVEFDGNNQWVTVADLSKCGGSSGGCDCVYRFNGSTIQHWDDCAKAWADSGPAYNPSTDAPRPLLTILPSGSQCDATWNVAEEVYRQTQIVADALAIEADAFGAVLAIGGVLNMFSPVSGWASTLVAAIEVLLAEAGDLWDTAALYDDRAELRQSIYAGIGDDGTYDLAGYKRTMDKYATYYTTPVINATDLRRGLTFAMLTAMGPGSLQAFNKSHNLVDQDCTGFEWVHVFDFQTSSSGWYKFLSDGKLAGQWVYGDGWNCTFIVNSSGAYRPANIQAGWQQTHIEKIKVVFDSAHGVQDQSARIILWTYPYVDNVSTVIVLHEIVDGENQEWEYALDADMSGIAVELNVAIDNGGNTDPGGSGRIKQIVLSGTGVNPFL